LSGMAPMAAVQTLPGARPPAGYRPGPCLAFALASAGLIASVLLSYPSLMGKAPLRDTDVAALEASYGRILAERLFALAIGGEAGPPLLPRSIASSAFAAGPAPGAIGARVASLAGVADELMAQAVTHPLSVPLAAVRLVPDAGSSFVWPQERWEGVSPDPDQAIAAFYSWQAGAGNGAGAGWIEPDLPAPERLFAAVLAASPAAVPGETGAERPGGERPGDDELRLAGVPALAGEIDMAADASAAAAGVPALGAIGSGALLSYTSSPASSLSSTERPASAVMAVARGAPRRLGADRWRSLATHDVVFVERTGDPSSRIRVSTGMVLGHLGRVTEIRRQAGKVSVVTEFGGNIDGEASQEGPAT